MAAVGVATLIVLLWLQPAIMASVLTGIAVFALALAVLQYLGVLEVVIRPAETGIVRHVTGTFTTPSGSRTVTVDELDFEPDLLMFTATNDVSTARDPPERTDGWTYGAATLDSDGTIAQHSMSVANDARRTGAAVGASNDGRVLDILVHGDDGPHRITGAVEATTPEGFEVRFDTADLPAHRKAPGYEVLFEAFETADAADVSIGSFRIPREQTVQTIALGTAADFVGLTGITGPGGAVKTQTDGEQVGVSHGTAAADFTISQHAMAVTVEASATGRTVDASYDDRALYLPMSDDASGRVSARVTGLGEQLELTYDEVVTPESSGKGADGGMVAFVAIDTGDGPVPTVGHFELPAPGDGPRHVDAGFEPEAVTFTTGSANAVATETVDPTNPLSFNWSHGTATLTRGGSHEVLHGSKLPWDVANERPDLAVRGAAVVSDGGTDLSSGPGVTGQPPGDGGPAAVAYVVDEGRVRSRADVRVTDTDQTGFTVKTEYVGLDDPDLVTNRRPVIFFTAWPTHQES